MNTSNRKYSVLMSVYYKENPDWLDIAIQSMLNQTIFPDEFVIIEDGAIGEKLEAIISKYIKQYPHLFNVIKLKNNVGLGPALKIGIENCKNEYIARMDSDDYSVPSRVEKQFKIFEKYQHIGLVGSNVKEFIDNIDHVVSLVILPECHREIYKFSKKRCPFRHPSLLYKKTEVIKAGNYREYYLCEDYDLYTRMLKNNCQCYNIQDFLVYMRIGEDFYKRRGGLKYLKSIIKFKNEQLHTGYFNILDYLKSTIPHIIVCLIPNQIRDFIYRNLLRKKIKNEKT